MKITNAAVQELAEKEKQGSLQAQDLIKHVCDITGNIADYASDDDRTMLKRLKKLCVKMKMPEETARMLRNIAMHHFYRSDIENAVKHINQALRISRGLQCFNLYIMLLSDKGLILFYDLKYKTAKKLYHQAFELLPHTDALDNTTRHLLYYRAGILYSYMGDYADAYQMFDEALKYAKSVTDTGWVLVNMGVLHERQGRYDEALNQYDAALKLYGEDYSVERSSVYNNIAQVYKDLGEYEIALKNIGEAFELLGCKNMSKFFIFFQTYTEIKILQGEAEAELQKLVGLIKQVKDFFVYKCFVVDGINTVMKTSSQDKLVLSELSDEITAIVDDIGCRNKEYKKELNSFLSDICLSLRVLSL